MKFAYLVMAHHRFDVLQELLIDLDDVRNDIFLHIDKKSKDFNSHTKEKLMQCVKNSNLYFISRKPVYWGHYSQIDCVMRLLENATKTNSYDYYHLLVGVEFPLKSQDKIHDFFNANYGKEFIGFDHQNKEKLNRVKLFHFTEKYARVYKRVPQWLYFQSIKLNSLQERLGVDRTKGRGESYYKKGYANWSITDGLSRMIVEHKKNIKRDYRWTFCADEIFIHTIVFHSYFYKNVYDADNEYLSCRRLTTWDNPVNQFTMKDLQVLQESNMLFARKLDGEDALDVIREIKNSRE